MGHVSVKSPHQSGLFGKRRKGDIVINGGSMRLEYEDAPFNIVIEYENELVAFMEVRSTGTGELLVERGLAEQLEADLVLWLIIVHMIDRIVEEDPEAARRACRARERAGGRCL